MRWSDSMSSKLIEYIERRPEALEWLRRIHDRWLEYKSRFKCYQCGSEVEWINDFNYRCRNGHEGRVLGLESWEFNVPPWFMRMLHDDGLVEILYKSRSSTNYGVPSSTIQLIEEVMKLPELGAEVSEEPTLVELTEDVFEDIVGLENIKELVMQVLKSDKPVHLLMVGPPASAKSMILEILSRHYGVPIILAGISTKAGIRDFIEENRPRVMLIDELDKVTTPLELSVLLSWMESQKITITMASKRIEVRCPSVCKVIAAANDARRIPPELLSRFIVVKIPQYTDEQTKEICINVLTKREGISDELAKYIADAVVNKLRSKDPRDCIKVARLKPKSTEDVERIVKLLGSTK